MNKIKLAAITLLLVVLTGGPAKAGLVFLVGAEQFEANASGSTISIGSQYDTNSNDSADWLSVNGQGVSPKNISLALSLGVNNFTFTTQVGGFLGNPNNVDLGLFFGTSSTSYDPSSAARTADLLESVSPSGSFFTPTAGSFINDYHFSGSNLANGLITFSIGGENITFCGLTITNGGGSDVGTFSLIVSNAVPEPSTIVLTASGLIGAVICMRRRRNPSCDIS